MKKSLLKILVAATSLILLGSTALFAKPNPKAASYKTHEAAAGDKTVPVVYFIREISPEALVKVYKATGY